MYLNARAFWRNVPTAVWSYKLGGYQVLKKWLSYRERDILDRPLTPEEVQHFTGYGAEDRRDLVEERLMKFTEHFFCCACLFNNSLVESIIKAAVKVAGLKA